MFIGRISFRLFDFTIVRGGIAMRKRVFSCVLVVIIVGSFCFVPSAALVSDLKDVINETTFAEYVRGDYFSKVVTAFLRGSLKMTMVSFFVQLHMQ